MIQGGPRPRKRAQWLMGGGGAVGCLFTPWLLWTYYQRGAIEPPYTGLVIVYGLLFAASLAALLGARRPTRAIAGTSSAVLFLLGLLTAPSNGGVYQFLAIPIAYVAAFEIAPPRGSQDT